MNAPVELRPDGDAGYRSETGHTLRREDHHDDGGNHLRGVWVLRDPGGSVVGYDRYRHDLEARHRVKIRD